MGASRPRNKTAWPLWSLAASALLTASAGMSSSAVATGSSASARLNSPDAALWHKASICSSEIMSASANGPAEVARQRAHIGALAAFGIEPAVVRIRCLFELQAVDVHHPRLQLEFLAVA